MIVPAPGDADARTVLLLDTETEPDLLPVVRWLGVGDPGPGALASAGPHRGAPLLVEHARGSFHRPGLRGHRLADGTAGAGARDLAGRDWSPLFRRTSCRLAGDALLVEAVAEHAGLALRTEVEPLVGGGLRIRHTLTNTGRTPYLLEALEVAVPLPDDHDEVLDFTGRHERERVPQRHRVVDGLWVRESREGRPGLGSATMLVTGRAGFGFGHGEVVAMAVATSGNATLAVERSAAAGATLSGGELLLPGELVLTPGESYTMPWVVVVAAADGLDGIAAALHAWQRSLPAHPTLQPVTLNVWEAVYFDHDLPRLTELAERAARIGVERFVLDDGWFGSRRDDRSGLGDWWVSPDVWPEGLTPLVTRVRELGMQFGLWFEPEMVNPDSELYRAHPDWVLATDGRSPRLQRHQLVVDLTNDEAWTYVRDSVDAVLSAYPIDYVKWDHNRELLEAGSTAHGGSPGAHGQNEAFSRLLDDLRARHPHTAWESCASGGGRIDLGVLERVQRVWTSDMTDALARQQIQRWTVQLVAPEYLGAHVSAPISHQTGRALSLDFRAGTALFGAFGIEWDLTTASEDDLDRLTAWVRFHREHRVLLHSGRTVRLDVADPAVLAHGVVSADGSEALFAHVQLDESASNRGVVLRLPGLVRTAAYRLSWAAPAPVPAVQPRFPLDPAGPTGGVPVSGAALADVGIRLPRRPPETVTLIEVRREGATPAA